MLVLKIVENRETKKKRTLFGKKHLSEEPKRYSVTVNGGCHTVVELAESDLEREDVKKLCEMYSGRILAPSEYKNHKSFDGKLFSGASYTSYALISSLVNLLKCGNDKSSSVGVKLQSGVCAERLSEAVPYIKSLTLIVGNCTEYAEFCHSCYINYGVKPHILNESGDLSFDVFADVSAFDENNRVFMIYHGKTCVLYPDASLFSDAADYGTFVEWGIPAEDICAAFSPDFTDAF